MATSGADALSSSIHQRTDWFVLALLLIASVMDGWSGKPSPFTHQLLLIPVTSAFCFSLWRFLFSVDASMRPVFWALPRMLLLAAAFIFCNLAILGYERKHFAALAYFISPAGALTVTVPFAIILIWLAFRQQASTSIISLTLLCAAVANFLISILHFPLNYLRSDMLPVIQWADTSLLHGISPYEPIFVGTRIYDFPYLPGMLVAYLPFVALHIDLRYDTLVCLIAIAVIIYLAARIECRLQVAVVTGLVLLNPFLQYRHEIYLEPHWLLLIASFVLMQRRRHLIAAFVFGLSMALYQFSWIMLPFILLWAWRRTGSVQVLKEAALAILAMLLIVGPFLRSAAQHISHNAVGQWGGLLHSHAQAEPMNLSFWVTYVVPPSRLLPLQALVMVLIFGYCLFAGRCRTFADTLRWIIVALTIFIMLNVLVDGYFYLMLLIPMLAYLCVANGWWSEGPEQTSPPRAISRSTS